MLLLALSSLLLSFVNAKCYESSPAHPLPDYDPRNALLQHAFDAIDTKLDGIIAAERFDTSAFSIEVTSSKESLWSRHHTARVRNESRPDIPTVNGDALYRIASITKTFTVLGVLYQHAAGNLSLDDTIDTYIEELKGKQHGSIPWKDITLRSLASQLSGIPREFAQSDLINESFNFSMVDVGFPPVSREGLPTCDEYSPTWEPCGRSDLIKTVQGQEPMFAPNQKAVYSNVAYELLGLAIENVTGLSYEQYINKAIFEPLGMTKSTLSKPPDSAGVIPLGPQYWDIDAGVQNPTGGIYSSATDLSKYLRYILTHYNGITHALNWIHPVSPGEGVYSFYGMPWEILHTDKVLLNSKRMVRFVTKAGGLPGYFSNIIFLPDYDLGISILVAGELDLLGKLREVVTVELVRAAEAIAIEQLQQRYTGVFSSSDPSLNSSVTFEADERGLVVTSFISNSTDFFKSPIWDIVGAPTDRKWAATIIPTLLYRDEEAQEGELWRMSLSQERLDSDTGIWDDFCTPSLGGALYAGRAIDELVFWKGEDGVAEAVELTGFRVKLVRENDQPAIHHEQGEQEILEL